MFSNPSSSASVASSLLLGSSFDSIHSSLSTLQTRYDVWNEVISPAVNHVSEQAHDAHCEALSIKYKAHSAQLRSAEHGWSEATRLASKAQLNQLEALHQAKQLEAEDSTEAHALRGEKAAADEAQEAVMQQRARMLDPNLNGSDDSLHGSKARLIPNRSSNPDGSPPKPLTLFNLPLPCMRQSISFLSRSDLASLISTSSASQSRWDRGYLWAVLAASLVRTIITRQRDVTHAAELKRRQLGGLPQDFHSMNFIAACGNRALTSSAGLQQQHQQQLQTQMRNNLNGTPTISTAAAQAAELAAADLPPTARTHISISIPTKGDAATVAAAAAAAAAKKGTSAPSPSASTPTALNPAAPPGSKADLFARAFHHLQMSVDPILSDFEDLSLKLSSHQRIIQFLEQNVQKAKHDLAVLKVTLGSEQHENLLLNRRKEVLEKSIRSIETQVAQEKKNQLEIQQETEREIREIQRKSNMRRQVEEQIKEEKEQQRVNQKAHQQRSASSNPFDEPEENASASPPPPPAAADLHEPIAKLKQQKKILIKAVRSLTAEKSSLQSQREEAERKLQALKQKLGEVERQI